VIKTTAQILLVSGVVMGLCVSPGLAAGGRHCQDIGGGVLTNFLDPTQCASPVGLCTDGPVTGDLRGAVGVQVLGVNGNVYHVRHHWVTESGDPRRTQSGCWQITSTGSISPAERGVLTAQPATSLLCLVRLISIWVR
jgi:hypothetical protein